MRRRLTWCDPTGYGDIADHRKLPSRGARGRWPGLTGGATAWSMGRVGCQPATSGQCASPSPAAAQSVVFVAPSHRPPDLNGLNDQVIRGDRQRLCAVVVLRRVVLHPLDSG